ncbi:G-coupled receptor -like protein [Brachionus plicatilis]|uniref:G-coupled receptor-like protein n=1 Tax=Brachionus plicatilis TaxID=10195 RepID=A0A3M7SGG3_BRAPC|nr:G-coupled receptor -like protein [Brachionus plicatilis]
MKLQQYQTAKPLDNKALALNLSIFNFSSNELEYVYRIRSIRHTLPWFIVSFGLIGNFFIIFIFLNRKKRGFSSNAFCFCALAITDSMALIFMLLQSMLSLNVVSNLSVACKLIKFIYYSSLQLSSWCLVLLTIDRLIAVLFIFKYKSWNKKFWAPKILIGIIVCIILLNLHIAIMTESQIKKKDIYDLITTKKPSNFRLASFKEDKPKLICSVNSVKFPIYSKLIFDNWDIYHAIIYGGLPFLIILVSNIAIILKLSFLKNSKIQKAHITRGESTKSLDKIDKSIKSVQITVMLLSIAFIFLFFTGPISFYMTFFYQNLSSVNRVKLQYIKVVLKYIAYINNAINFYVYVALSSEFRKEFVRLVRCCLKLRVISSTVSKCTTSTSVGSLDKFDDKQRPLPPITKPIVRKGLKFENQADLTRPFIDPNKNALEQFKFNNRQKKAFIYKNDKKSNPIIPEENNEKSLFVNSVSTYV